VSIRQRLARVEKTLKANTPDREAIIECERQWCNLALMELLVDRACREGKCIELRYHFESDHREERRGKRCDAIEKNRWLLEAYDRTKGTPGWTEIGAKSKGYTGAPRTDPKKLEGALAAWIKRYGLPDRPITWTDALEACGGPEEDDPAQE
jgi:hypothetical protein